MKGLKVKRITFPTELEKIEDIENDNMDIFVELDDGTTYTLVVGTPKNLLHLMEKDKISFCVAGPPMLLVKELTYKNIKAVVESFCEGDAYWLKEYYLSGSFDQELLNAMLEDIKRKNQGIDNA